MDNSQFQEVSYLFVNNSVLCPVRCPALIIGSVYKSAQFISIQDDSTDSEAEFEQLKKAAQIKYANFRQEFSHMLDPKDADELKKMEKLGLPVMFINSRTDVSFNP